MSRTVSVLRSHLKHEPRAGYALSRLFLTRERPEYSDVQSTNEYKYSRGSVLYPDHDRGTQNLKFYPLFWFVSKIFPGIGSADGLRFVRWYRVPVVFSRGVRRARSVAYSRSGAPTTTVGGSTMVVADRAPARLGRPQVGVQRYLGYVRAVGSRGGAPTYLLTASTGALPRLVTRDSTSHLTAPTDKLRRRGYLLVKDEPR